MIRVNLLDSVTDRAKGVAAVEDKVASPRAQTILMGLVVVCLLVVGIAYDYVSTTAAHANAERELVAQKAIAAKMKAVNDEQAELAKKTAEVQNRIDAIQKLRESQQGPGDILREVKELVDSIPGLYMESVEQKGADLTIKGASPNESSVARLGQSLEFSGGRFNDLSIQTERKTADQLVAKDAPKGSTAVIVPTSAVKPEIVEFTIKCTIAPHTAQQPNATNTPGTPPGANQPAQK